MDGHRAGLVEIAARSGDRFVAWPQRSARLALAILVLFMALAAVAPGYSPPPPPPPKIAVAERPGTAAGGQEDDNDIRLYRVINTRLRHGENYYRAATEEQRAHGYPVAPGFTVRLPSLAWLAVVLGDPGMIVLGLVLFAAMLLALHRRLTQETGGAERAPMALALVLGGIASGLDHRYNVLHEIWAAQLVTLSFALHRPSADSSRRRWGWAWLVAALALAVRELALPYVVLQAACAAWDQRRREALAWLALIALFALAMLVHLHFASEFIRPDDSASPSWLAPKGIAGLLYKVNNSTFLNLLPVWITGPAVVFALFGWAGWDTPMGRFGFLLTAGYGLAFMVFGRDNNFYWGLMITPVLFMGGAFAPRALLTLWRQAGPGSHPEQLVHA